MSPWRGDDDFVKPVFGVDYDLERWSTGERDDAGRLIWHQTLPANDEWQNIQYVTLNFSPGAPDKGDDFRTYHISPYRPLDPYGLNDGREDWYDLDDLAQQAFIDYGFEAE